MSFKHYKVNITRQTDELIVIGPYTGSYGHFFCHYLPFLAKFRREYPKSKIVCSADNVFKFYATQFCDHFYGFNHNWSIVLAPGSVQEETDDCIFEYLDIVRKDIGEPDLYIDTFRDGIPLHNLYITAQSEVLTMFRNIEYNPKSKRIVLWPRFKLAATERNGNLEHWNETAEHLLSQGFEVYSAGVPEVRITHPNVYDYTTFYDDVTRGRLTHALLQTSRCVLFDQSGVFNEILFTGTPGLIFNCDPGHIKKIPYRNIFQTKLSFYTPKPWEHWQKNPLVDGDLSYMPEWLNEVDKFIDECITDKPWLHTQANHAGVFTVLDS